MTAARDFTEGHLAPTILTAHIKLGAKTGPLICFFGEPVVNLYGYVGLPLSSSFLTVRTFEYSSNPQVYGAEGSLGFICGIPRQMSSSYGDWDPC